MPDRAVRYGHSRSLTDLRHDGEANVRPEFHAGAPPGSRPPASFFSPTDRESSFLAFLAFLVVLALRDGAPAPCSPASADRRGASNNISPAQVVAAASSVWRGRALSLAAPVESQVAPDNPDPAVHQMIHSGTSFVRCATCDGYPCLVHAKADADTIAVRPLLDQPNVTLLVNAEVERLETDPSGRTVTRVHVNREGSLEFYEAGSVGALAVQPHQEILPRPAAPPRSPRAAARHHSHELAAQSGPLRDPAPRSGQPVTLTMQAFPGGEPSGAFWSAASPLGPSDLPGARTEVTTPNHRQPGRPLAPDLAGTAGNARHRLEFGTKRSASCEGTDQAERCRPIRPALGSLCWEYDAAGRSTFTSSTHRQAPSGGQLDQVVRGMLLIGC